MEAEKHWIERRLEVLGLIPMDLARALGLENRTASIYEIFTGKRRLQPKEYVRTARLLKLDLQAVVDLANGDRSDLPDEDTPNSHTMDTQLPALLVWKSAPMKGARHGGFMLYSEKSGRVGRIRRPEDLDHAENAFTFKVVDDKHSPAFKTRDIALVDPDDPVAPDDDCLFTDESKLAGGAETLIALLKRVTDTSWVVEQHSRPGVEVELPRVHFPDVWRIVGRRSRR